MSRLNRRQVLGAGLAAVAGASGASAKKKRPGPEMNVLFISIADLRPELGCYGSAEVLSPNIDRLASGGLTMLRAYVQQSNGALSRRSLLRGVRPEEGAGAQSMPDQFARYGYQTASVGDPASAQAGAASHEALDVADEQLPDGRTASDAIAAMKRLHGQGLFFLSVNFQRPSLPFVAPKSYYDLYPKGLIKPAGNPDPPLGAPPFALHDSQPFRAYSDVSGPLQDELARALIRAYYASITFVDAQVGRLLKTLEDLNLHESTTVVLLGDRGFHLGEHGLWGGDSNYEAALRVPLIIRSPGQRGGGRKSFALTELVDVYPTLCDLSKVPMPSGLEGSAFTPLFEDPDRLWKRAVFSSLPREIPGVGPGVGRTMRTKRFRYTEWTSPGSAFRAAEVYDYREDPAEMRNLVGRPEAASLVNGLAGMLQEGWQASLPPTDARGTANS